VITRARDLLREFEQGAPTPDAPSGVDAGQLPLFGGARGAGTVPVGLPESAEPRSHPVLDTLAALDPDRLTPLEALTALHELRRRLASES
jgi:DNA mismatch repair protein MutS